MAFTGKYGDKSKQETSESQIGHSPTCEPISSVQGDSEVGTTLTVGDLYCNNSFHLWRREKPAILDLDLESTNEYKGLATILRRERNRQNTQFVLHSIIVQSPYLRKVLDMVFEGYKGTSTKLRALEFSAPFHEFYYRWEKLMQLFEEERVEISRKHIDLFRPSIESEIFPHMEMMQNFTKNGVISGYRWTRSKQ